MIIIGAIYQLVTNYIPEKSYTKIGFIVVCILIAVVFFNPYSNIVFLSISNVLSFPFQPIGLALLLLAVGSRYIKKDLGQQLVWVSLVILLLSSIPFIAYKLAYQAELEAVQFTAQIQKTYKIAEEKPKAIVVLAQGTTKPNIAYRPQIELTDTGDRLLYTAQLYTQEVKDKNTPLIIVSAGLRPELSGNVNKINEGQDVAKFLGKFDIPVSQILLDDNGIDFNKSASGVKKILNSKKLEDDPVFLVSSAYHIKRAYLTFANQGIKSIPKPCNFYTIQQKSNPSRTIIINDFLPSADALLLTNRIIQEYLTSIYYFIRGWLTPNL
ncbi:MAG TPA: YdcF family protein [Allocoleopsis sp.]